ncbi:MAG: sugar phosphate isomerase/epimerase [Clostridia bacterium]|nr:sugar phosphate isomerase/epimerase [Clostridia bacterium]
MDRHIGAQLFTIRDFMQTEDDFITSMQKIKKIGFDTVQISGTPLKAKFMKEVLDELDLKCVVTHRAFQDFKENLSEIMEYNSILGCDSCSIGIAPVDMLKTDDGVSAFIEEANTIADKLYDNGFVFGYHNHSAEFVKHNSRTIMDRFLTETDPDKFRFILDTYWVQVGGKDPAKFIREIGKRAMYVHFKDLRIHPDAMFVPEFSEVGEGNLDWDDIIAACDEAGAKCALIEQDTCRRDPFESLKISRDFLVSKGFK